MNYTQISNYCKGTEKSYFLLQNKDKELEPLNHILKPELSSLVFSLLKALTHLLTMVENMGRAHDLESAWSTSISL